MLGAVTKLLILALIVNPNFVATSVKAHLSQSLSRGKKDAVIMRVVRQGEGKTRKAPPPIAFFGAEAAFQMVH